MGSKYIERWMESRHGHTSDTPNQSVDFVDTSAGEVEANRGLEESGTRSEKMD